MPLNYLESRLELPNRFPQGIDSISNHWNWPPHPGRFQKLQGVFYPSQVCRAIFLLLCPLFIGTR